MATLTLKRRAPSLGALSSPPAATPPAVIDTPLPSASNMYKAAIQGASLYHTCRSVLDRLASVDGMTEYLDAATDTSPSQQQQLDPSISTSTASSSSSSSSTSSSSAEAATMVEPTTPTTASALAAAAADPLSKLWSICRRGLPLCILFNALQPEKPLKVDDRDPNLNQVNTCKASVYYFLVACRNQLQFPEEDVFTITDLYSDDTNGFVKVVNTINKILHLLEEKGLISVRCANRNSDPNAPKDTRGKVVMELLETERKYVQDLETLQNYMRELIAQKILSLDTIHYLFGNLNALVDFQRRYLIMVEDMAEKPAQEQRIGLLFVQLEEAFAVYEPYCANYYSAQDLVVQEAPKLQKLADVLNPTYELPSYLIKPVQRICKYPLLMGELVKSTNKDWPCYAEMNDGLEAIRRVAEKVNETQRKHENVQAVEELKKRIDDNSNSIESYGSLLVQDKLGIMNKDTEREMAVFLFEKMLLICKESKDAAKNRLTKSNTIMKKKRRGSLQERIRIPASRILGVHNRSSNGVWMLSIEYKASDVEVFTFRLRNEEQTKLWETTMNKIKFTSRTHVPNTHLYSMPSPTYHGDTASFMDDEDEEDDYYYDDEDDENAAPAPTRSRSNSISAQLFNTLSGRPKNEVKSRQYQHQMPGMNLSPLPRASASTNTQQQHHHHHHHHQAHHPDYAMYPASPPPSHPSSPTSSSRISTGSSWHHQGGHHHYHYHGRGDSSPLTEIASKFMTGDIPTPTEEELRHFPLPPAVNRSQSQSAAVGSGVYNNNNNNNGAIPPVPGMKHHQNRMRSQSSPNIHKAATTHAIAATAAAAAAMMPPQYPLNNNELDNNVIRPVASTPRLSDAHNAGGGLKVKLSYNDGIYVIKAAENVGYMDLMEKVEKKIRLIGNLKTDDTLRLKYQDEDGDYITINSDDDVQMAFENRGRSPSVSLYVNV
ncbi:hypothetical protein BDB00DRAFT_877917 [Zychaea mexicana]|uniref:uncharacterized protein n=1 Tax=Zychaea mexicana TaxID=64656 RepID=UPI0022FEF456|nr:uncharacterized protein BDB00DRAFT_877917 [Zychaea mexicana]KAI9487999.1 hypothetical protein BDB00DRAFT_877917 [Zychaea mexicana]